MGNIHSSCLVRKDNGTLSTLLLPSGQPAVRLGLIESMLSVANSNGQPEALRFPFDKVDCFGESRASRINDLDVDGSSDLEGR